MAFPFLNTADGRWQVSEHYVWDYMTYSVVQGCMLLPVSTPVVLFCHVMGATLYTDVWYTIDCIWRGIRSEFAGYV